MNKVPNFNWYLLSLFSAALEFPVYNYFLQNEKIFAIDFSITPAQLYSKPIKKSASKTNTKMPNLGETLDLLQDAGSSQMKV